jgi:predicted helicase
LEKEIKNKFSIGYLKDNILFWQPDKAVLFQNGDRFYEADLTKSEDLVKILSLFLEFALPAIAEWEKAVEEFKNRIPELGAQLGKLIDTERQTNKKFIAAFEDFCSLCRGSLNPNISVTAVEEMIIQHILTERIFRKVFAIADFISRNVIAQEIEKVITALNSRAFSRDDFSKNLEYFYQAIEHAAATITDFHEKQNFLNTVYERFFQGFCVKVADTHGIVYTPQPLVNFMVASVEHVLQAEFKKTLADKDVHILDPFTGTGNFIVNVMRHISAKQKSALPYKYANELHCNEIMLLPYYVASMNIEHAYYEATGKYESFEGVCLEDTFQTAEKEQAELSFFNEKNSARVDRQKKAPIRIIIGNPPYNAWQQDENDNNKNRKYPELDRRIRVTYSDDSTATLKNSLADPYIKAFRWASDRLGESGIVCFVTNNGFLEGIAGDGIRKHLAQDFDEIYHLDLKGDARTSGERRRKEGGNIFSDQIRVGVGITVLVRRKAKRAGSVIKLHRLPDYERADAKQDFLIKHESVAKVAWQKIRPDKRNNWLTEGLQPEFDNFLAIGSKEAKQSAHATAIFQTYSRGICSNNDDFVYDFDSKTLTKRAMRMIEAYDVEQGRWEKAGRPKDVEGLVRVDATVLKWIRRTKKSLARGLEVKFDAAKIRPALYRPFSRRFHYFERIFNEDVYQFPELFPNKSTHDENRVIVSSDIGVRSLYSVLAANSICDLHLCASIDAHQCFPLFIYSEDGKERRDNVTAKALTLFQIFYDDAGITREEVFHYVYAVLHHPAYRTRYAENLKRDLPRIPFIGVAADVRRLKSPAGSSQKKLEPPDVGCYENKFFPLTAIATMQGDATPAHNPAASAKLFHAFADAGKKLAALHVNYESAKEYKLKRTENKEAKLDWRVEAMKLSKDKTSLFYNEFLTLGDIPPEVFAYKLGNRSALDWVIDQYRVTRDEQGNIASDPNRMDDEEYIVRLIGQVITVSLETQKIVNALPAIIADGAV